MNDPLNPGADIHNIQDLRGHKTDMELWEAVLNDNAAQLELWLAMWHQANGRKHDALRCLDQAIERLCDDS